MPLHPARPRWDAQGRPARDACAAAGDSRRPVAPFWVRNKGFALGKAPFMARVAAVLGVASPGVSFLRPERDAGVGYGRVRSQLAQKREERAKGLGWVLNFSCFSDSFLAVLPSLPRCGVAAAAGRRDGTKGRGDAPWVIGKGLFVLALAVLLPAQFQWSFSLRLIFFLLPRCKHPENGPFKGWGQLCPP